MLAGSSDTTVVDSGVGQEMGAARENVRRVRQGGRGETQREGGSEIGR